MDSYYERNREKIIEKRRKWRDENKEKEKEQTRRYREKHRDILRERSAIQKNKNPDRNKIFHQKNRDAINKRRRELYRTNINTKMIKVLRARLCYGVRSCSAVRDLGCSIEELIAYLESKFLPGMSWANWSKTGWHIDHIRPLSSFDLSDRNQAIQAVHYTNLQPLWAADNMRKSDKFQTDMFA